MIEIKHLKKQYEEATPLKDVNTTINKGDVIAVIGPSGTGKSTLLRCINMLEQPTEGHIFIDGEDITDPKCDVNILRRKLGMVFQSFNLYEHLTVIENCMLAQTKLLKRSRQEAYDKSMELLKSVGMDEKALQYPSQLSGGQKQRAAIARTLATDPEIILFDEPTSALDPLSVLEIEDIINRLSKEGKTMMIVTHGMDFAERVANRVFYMDQGEIYEDGTPEQIFNNPQKPLTREFILSLSSMSFIVNEDNHDLNKEIGKIFSYCKSKKIDDKRTSHACAMYEEFYLMLDRYSFKDLKILYFDLEYIKNEDKLMITFTPGSSKGWNEIGDTVMKSLEFKIFASYIKGYYQEMKSDRGVGVSYVYEVK